MISWSIFVAAGQCTRHGLVWKHSTHIYTQRLMTVHRAFKYASERQVQTAHLRFSHNALNSVGVPQRMCSFAHYVCSPFLRAIGHGCTWLRLALAQWRPIICMSFFVA